MSPDFVERERIRLAEVAKSNEPIYRELAPLNEELAAAGLPSVQELLRVKNTYRESIPILCKWLPLLELYSAKSWVVSVLRVPIAKPKATNTLIEAFLKADEWRDPKWEMGAAISCAMDDSVADEVIEIAMDKRHGPARAMIVDGLWKLKDSRVEDTLITLLNDQSVYLGAVSALKKAGTAKAKPHLERFLTDKNAWLRKEAKKAIENIDKRSGRPQPPKAPQINRVSSDAPIPAGLEEWSANSDYEWLEPLLKALSGLVKVGFGSLERQQVLDASDAIDENGAAAFDFPCKYAGQQISVRVILRIEDDEPDLYIFGPPSLIKEFREKADRVIERLEVE